MYNVGDAVIYTENGDDYFAEYAGDLPFHPYGIKIRFSPEGAPNRDGEMLPLNSLANLREARFWDLFHKPTRRTQ